MNESQLMLEPRTPQGAASDSSPAPQPPAPEPPDWPRRAEEWRAQEWEMAQKLLAAARDLLARLLRQPKHKVTVADVRNFIDLASRLAGHSTAPQTEQTEATGESNDPYRLQLDDALKKIYGEVLSPAEKELPLPPTH